MWVIEGRVTVFDKAWEGDLVCGWTKLCSWTTQRVDEKTALVKISLHYNTRQAEGWWGRYQLKNRIQLDLGYPAISYPDISIIRPSVIRISPLSGHDLVVYCLLSIFNYSLAQDKNKVVKYLFYFIVYPFYMNDNLLQIE